MRWLFCLQACILLRSLQVDSPPNPSLLRKEGGDKNKPSFRVSGERVVKRSDDRVSQLFRVIRLFRTFRVVE